MAHHSQDYIMLYGKRDFAYVIVTQWFDSKLIEREFSLRGPELMSWAFKLEKKIGWWSPAGLGESKGQSYKLPIEEACS